MQLSDFDYDLPTELIAQAPLSRRSASRLLCLDGVSGGLKDRRFRDLPDLLRPDDLLVFNDTRVIPARLLGHKLTSGGRVEVLVERITGELTALVHLRASKAPSEGVHLLLEDAARVQVQRRDGALFELRFEEPVLEVLERHGRVPLPPYIQREDDSATDDHVRYQTVFARHPGAVAAPTAGLHFDESILEAIRARGVRTASVTLHVGAGTFQPVRVTDIRHHVMHGELAELAEETCERIAACRAQGGRVVAVGTTTVRTLESAAQAGALRPYRDETRLFITPGYRFRVVDAMITNFHLPQSTLLMLVSAFAGHAHVMAAYRHAVRERYRFFSYGDAMFLSPPAPEARA